MIFKNTTLLVLLNVLTTAYALKSYPDAGTPCYTNQNCNDACFHGRFEVGKDQNGTDQLACSLSDPRKNEYYCAKCSKPATIDGPDDPGAVLARAVVPAEQGGGV